MCFLSHPLDEIDELQYLCLSLIPSLATNDIKLDGRSDGSIEMHPLTFDTFFLICTTWKFTKLTSDS